MFGFGKTKPKTTSVGKTLGGTFDVVFTDSKLGLSIGKAEGTGQAVVIKVTGAAAKCGRIQPGDHIVGVEACPVTSYDEVMSIVPVAGRPLKLVFSRPSGGNAAPAKRRLLGKSLGGGGGGSSGGGGSGVVSDAERDARRARQAAAVEARSNTWGNKCKAGRKATRAAANEAAAHANALEAARNETPAEAAARERLSAQRVQEARAREAQTMASLGYNPYEATSAGTTAARGILIGAGNDAGASTSASVSVGAGAGGSVGFGGEARQTPALQPLPSQPPVLATNAAAATLTDRYDNDGSGNGVGSGDISDVDLQMALALSISSEAASGPGASATKDSGRGLEGTDNGATMAAIARLRAEAASGGAARVGVATALRTMTKMLRNIVANPDAPKFRRVRLGNDAIRQRVVAIDGAVDALLAAGFTRMQEEDGQDVLLLSGTGAPAPLVLALDRLEQFAAELT